MSDRFQAGQICNLNMPGHELHNLQVKVQRVTQRGMTFEMYAVDALESSARGRLNEGEGTVVLDYELSRSPVETP
jgi:hypothetical protein